MAYGYDGATGACLTDADTLPKPWNLNWPGVTNKVTGAMNLATDPANKLLVVSYREQNGLRWFDPAQKGKSVDELAGLDQPAGIAVKADGTVLIIVKGAVWSLTRTDKTLKPVIPADKLQSPWRLDVNSARPGKSWLPENSDEAGGPRRHHQVKKFSATGELLATYGKPGGPARRRGVHRRRISAALTASPSTRSAASWSARVRGRRREERRDSMTPARSFTNGSAAEAVRDALHARARRSDARLVLRQRAQGERAGALRD